MATENMIDNKMCCCIIMLFIVVLFTDSIIMQCPMIKNLFTDRINYILLVSLVIFTICLDLHCGIMFALAVLYMSMYITTTKSKIVISKNNNNKNNSTSTLSSTSTKPTIKTLSNSINNKFEDTVNNNTISKRSVKFNEEENIINLPEEQSIRSESEFIYDNTRPFPNNNIKPFDNNNENSKATVFTNEYTNEDNLSNSEGEPDRSGFDVSGCRYDMKNSSQNLTKNGPPLAQCSAYDTNKLKSCGTLFYPLNA
jgi:hypothetical protein